MTSPPTTKESSVPKAAWRLWSLLAVIAIVAGAYGGWIYHERASAHRLQHARALAHSNAATAIAEYRRVLEHDPANATVRLELAALLKRRDPEETLQELRKIPPSDPRYPDAVRQGAALAIDLGRDYDAVDPLLFLAEKFPEDAGVQLALAEVRFRSRDFEAALVHAQQARVKNPQLAEACLVEAEALDELKRSTEMVEPLEAALKIDAEIPQAHLNLAFAYQLLGRNDEAYEHAAWFVKRFPNSAAAYRTMALVQRGRGQPEEALAAVQQSLRLRPNHLEATLLEVELLLYLRRYEVAYQQITSAYRAHGAEQRVLTTLVRASLLSGRREESQQWQRQLERLLAADTTT